jgi:hypothetical protein
VHGDGSGRADYGRFNLIAGLDGIGYSVRPQSVGIIHDAGECHDEDDRALHDGHVVWVRRALDEALVGLPRAAGW